LVTLKLISSEPGLRVTLKVIQLDEPQQTPALETLDRVYEVSVTAEKLILKDGAVHCAITEL
jgi:hypothetical protein